jgi:hypothetical protein
MKKIILILITFSFIFGCSCDKPHTFDNKDFCYECHDYTWPEIDCSYSRKSNCIKCHKLDSCERGNNWKERELSKKQNEKKDML